MPLGVLNRLGLDSRGLRTHQVWGGTLNLLRHCALARQLGADAVIATASGRNPYDDRNGVGSLPTIPWRARRANDVCVLPDVLTWLMDQVSGPVVAYMQNPTQIRPDFDAARADLRLWTDSPPMEAQCRALFPGREVTLVPNIVDPDAFPYVPQAEREPGELVAFPRKGPEFIDATWARYQEQGGRYFRLARIQGLAFADFARRMRRPQVFLASSEVEGCALPPQECMAAGIVVVGRNAGGANFCMQHGETALVADTPDAAAAALREAEDPALRERLAVAGRAWIRRFFPDAEPTSFWRGVLASLR